jgi:hypothetical protein
MKTLTFENVAAALTEDADWIYAKTMPQCPHHYTLRKHWTSPHDFEAVVQYIRDYGYPEKFYSKRFIRFDINNRKYWSMGAPLPATILINRADIDREEPYDRIADRYDALWTGPEARREEANVIAQLDYRGGDILDIGCGTGMLLHHLHPDGYLGIDPSARMLERFRAHHDGQATTIQTRFESLYTRRRFDLIVALFGTASYIRPDAWDRLPGLLAPGGRFYLMFYRDDRPVRTHERIGFHPTIYPASDRIIGGWQASEHYIVVKS